MAYDINQSLQRLEENLQQLDTARNQVESTVTASNQLQQAVTGYLSAISNFVEEVKGWKRHLTESQEQQANAARLSVGEVQQLCKQVAETFKEDTNASITRLNGVYASSANDIE